MLLFQANRQKMFWICFLFLFGTLAHHIWRKLDNFRLRST